MYIFNSFKFVVFDSIFYFHRIINDRVKKCEFIWEKNGASSENTAEHNESTNLAFSHRVWSIHILSSHCVLSCFSEKISVTSTVADWLK